MCLGHLSPGVAGDREVIPPPDVEHTTPGVRVRWRQERPQHQGVPASMFRQQLAPDSELSNAQAVLEWRAFWALVADACDQGVRSTHPQHPALDEMQSLLREARLAAGLHAEPLRQIV